MILLGKSCQNVTRDAWTIFANRSLRIWTSSKQVDNQVDKYNLTGHVGMHMSFLTEHLPQVVRKSVCPSAPPVPLCIICGLDIVVFGRIHATESICQSICHAVEIFAKRLSTNIYRIKASTHLYATDTVV